MSTDAYDQIRNRFSDLTPEEQDQLVRELTVAVAQRTPSSSRRSILELRGLGKHVWQGIDASEYVRKERASWHTG
jgi:hypothetical protein